MAQPGVTPFTHDLRPLRVFVKTLLDAGEAGRRATTLEKRPTERWAPFKPAKAASRLHSRGVHLLARYGWHRSGSAERNESWIDEIEDAIRASGHELSRDELHQVLIAAAYWVDPPPQSVFLDDDALLALEDFVYFVSGYAMSLPRRQTAEHPDSLDRLFRAFQRRRNGYEAPTRTPKALVRRLPVTVQELLDTYADQYSTNPPEVSFALAETIAVALCRPMDTLFARQIELALVTAMFWRRISQFPAVDEGHPLLGRPRESDTQLWETARDRVDATRSLLDGPPAHTDPFLGQKPVCRPVLGVDLDARSTQALQRLDEYIHAFATWARSEPAKRTRAEHRLPAFDAQFRSTDTPVVGGAEIISSLSPAAIKVIANAGALLARGRSIEEGAVELATAFGDRNLGPRCHRTLVTATAWLNGQPSKMERTPGSHVAKPASEARILKPFASASSVAAESLLDLGASIADLVRFSQTLDQKSADGRTPRSWWLQFHQSERTVGFPTSIQLLSRLPEEGRKLLAYQARLLSDSRNDDLTASARVLASTLGREGEIICVRTLAVALSAGAVWMSRARLSNDPPVDTLLGVIARSSTDRYFCGRAQEQLEWGLQELLHSETVVGV